MWGFRVLLICFISVAGFTYLLWLFLYRTALIFILKKWCDLLLDSLHVHQHFRVPEFNDGNHYENHLYKLVSLYLNSLPSLEDSDYANLKSGKKSNDIHLSPEANRPIGDVFLGARVSWVKQIERDDRTRSFVLRIRKKDRRRILQAYLQHIHSVAGDVEQRGKQLKIYNNVEGKWKPAPFNHPASFDSLVIDPEIKSKIKHDLETFVKSEQGYHKLGRVWKRSYLLCGPSGTGKSSFIAATANLLNYDLYNLNLWQIADDADLNTLLLRTRSKSVVVVEDLDLYLKAKPSISFSGLLNFMDGILNSQDEKITIFTTNSKDGIDSALLRPGRIDVHISFPLCDFNSFKNLASNYLGVKEHKLFPQVEEIFQNGATISAAEVSELMLVNRSSPSRALRSVILALQSNSRNAEKSTSRISSTSGSSSSVAEISGSKDSVPKDQFRKLYGRLGLKSCSKIGPSDIVDAEMIVR